MSATTVTVADGRRRLIAALGALAATPLAARASGAPGTAIEVWHDASCGCCKDWMAYLRREGFTVTAHAEGNVAARRRLGLPDRFGSCHTATVGGYLVEGHVPAPDIRRMLSQRPAALGLAVPGMPIGSPGMDQPIYKGRKDPYDVMLVRRDGTATVFASYR